VYRILLRLVGIWPCYNKNASACFWNTVNFVGFSVIHVSQGNVATYVRCGGYIAMYSKFLAESDSGGIFKIG